MLNSILKFVGLSAGKSLQSAADPKSVKHPKQGITLDRPENDRSVSHGVAGSARRQEVKAPVKKSSTVKKAVAKPKASPAKKAVAKPAAKVASKSAAKPMGKAASKPAAKPAIKAGAKALVKTAAKAVAKAPAKSIAKPASKRVAKKPVAKPVTKPVKSAAKPVAKSPAKPLKAAAKPVKVSAKPVSKPVLKPAPKKASVSAKSVSSSVKPIAKPAVKTADKPVVKTAAKPVAKTTAKPVLKPVAPVAAKAKAPAAKAAPAPVVAAAPAKAVVAPAPAPFKPKSSKFGLNSPANIAPKAMEVSTAAKTHFTMSSPVLAPPPQVAVKKDAKLVNNWKTKTAAQLTDQEAIAMPDAEYMKPLQLAFFRLKLVQLKKDILNSAGETTEHLREDTSVVPDPADRATIEEEHALELRTRDRERKLLKKIEQSISRIDADDYGYCDETGEAIGVARLIARPTASLSLEAQQRRELKQKMFGD
jgi:DnaK suppressor protein